MYKYLLLPLIMMLFVGSVCFPPLKLRLSPSGVFSFSHLNALFDVDLMWSHISCLPSHREANSKDEILSTTVSACWWSVHVTFYRSLRRSSALDFYDYLIRTCLVIFWMCTFYSPHCDMCARARALIPILLLDCCCEAVQGNPQCRHLWRLVALQQMSGAVVRLLSSLSLSGSGRPQLMQMGGGVMTVTTPSCSQSASSRTSLAFLF